MALTGGRAGRPLVVQVRRAAFVMPKESQKTCGRLLIALHSENMVLLGLLKTKGVGNCIMLGPCGENVVISMRGGALLLGRHHVH